MATAIIITDAGRAYIKAMGNPQGPHQLACELVGTQLAGWFGLPVFDYSILSIDSEIDEILFFNGKKADSGPAFVTKAETGYSLGGKENELEKLDNPDAISYLVVFDTWTRNIDRYPPDLKLRHPNRDNVFLKDLGSGTFHLIAMDHSCCFNWGRDLNLRILDIENVKDAGLYGLFPEFIHKVRQDVVEKAITQLRLIDENIVDQMIQTVPKEWNVDKKTRIAWKEMICQRATFVADTIMDKIAKQCWPNQFFDTQS
ncbi:MAG: HipA family kinase [Thermoguttaceae bacterium]